MGDSQESRITSKIVYIVLEGHLGIRSKDILSHAKIGWVSNSDHLCSYDMFLTLKWNGLNHDLVWFQICCVSFIMVYKELTLNLPMKPDMYCIMAMNLFKLFQVQIICSCDMLWCLFDIEVKWYEPWFDFSQFHLVSA